MTQGYRCPWCGNSVERELMISHGTVEIPVLTCVGWPNGPHEPQEMVRLAPQGEAREYGRTRTA